MSLFHIGLEVDGSLLKSITFMDRARLALEIDVDGIVEYKIDSNYMVSLSSENHTFYMQAEWVVIMQLRYFTHKVNEDELKKFLLYLGKEKHIQFTVIEDRVEFCEKFNIEKP